MNEYGEKEFIEWAKTKASVHQRKEPFCRVGDIWWASLGLNIGHEQNGGGTTYERPVLILKIFANWTCLIIPFTKQLGNSSARNFVHELQIRGETNYALLTQIRSLSHKRLNRKLGRIDHTSLEAIHKKIVRTISI